MDDSVDRRSFVTSTLAAGVALAGSPLDGARRSAHAVVARAAEVFKLKLRAALRDVPGACRRRSRRATRVHARRRLHRARRQRHEGPVRRRSGASARSAAATRHADGCVRRAHDRLEQSVALDGRRRRCSEKFLQEIRESVEVAKRVNTRYMVVVPGVADRRRDPELPDGERDRDAAAGGGDPRAAQSHHDDRAAEHAGQPSRADCCSRSRSSISSDARAEQPVVQDPVRHLPRADQRGTPHSHSRRRVARGRLHPDWRHSRAKRARHGRDQLSKTSSATFTRRATPGSSAWSTATRSPAKKANAP